MFRGAKFYIIVTNNSLIIKKDKSEVERVIEFPSFIPNVPFYCHFFDEDKNYLKDMKNLVRELKVGSAVIIVPDDASDFEVDKRVLTEFLALSGVSKNEIKPQSSLLGLSSEKYVSISRSVRTLSLRYTAYDKVLGKKYYDKSYKDLEQISLDIKRLHSDCEMENISVYINNINEDMEEFGGLGRLISLSDIIKNAEGGN